jgi:hypothetical protein
MGRPRSTGFDWIRAIYFRDRRYPPRTMTEGLDAAENAAQILPKASYNKPS